MKDIIRRLYKEGYLSEMDIHFARFIIGIHGKEDREVFLGAALLTKATATGDICLSLSAVSDTVLADGKAGQDPIQCPLLSVWSRKLLESRAVGRPGDFAPLILDDENRLYLYRYWEYEQTLSEAIKQRIQEEFIDIDYLHLKKGMERLFPEATEAGGNWQKIASLIAVLKRFSVISGGPGTGKTFLIAKILALILEQSGEKKVRILLSAPTGKAAARLMETIQRAKNSLNTDPWVKTAIPDEAYTLHRMLQTLPDSPYFRYDRKNPLPADVVVVDEASMVDLALMSKLIQAVPPNSRLILMGDKDQLASVEAGSVLGDICDRNNIHDFSDIFCKRAEEITGEKLKRPNGRGSGTSGLQDCIAILKKSYRFAADSGIGAFSRAVNGADAETALKLLRDPEEMNIERVAVSSPKDASAMLTDMVTDGYAPYLQTHEPMEALELFKRFKILCAHRRGTWGVMAVNRQVEESLLGAGLIKPRRHPDTWYSGRPVLVTQNDYDRELFNGDIGITLPLPGSARDDLYVFFRGPDGNFRRFAPHALPEHETAFAMTIHKSQGSEFESILLILPEKDSPVLTRELIYTGITRAKKRAVVWSKENILELAISKKITRTSGLRDALWG